MTHQLSFLHTIIPHLVLCIIIASLMIKIYCIALIGYKISRASSWHAAPSYLLTALFCSLFSDLAWAVKLCHKIMFTHTSYALVTFFIRIGWASIALQHQHLALFMHTLTQQKKVLTTAQKISSAIAYFFLIYFVYTAFFDTNLTSKEGQLLAQKMINNPPLEVIMVRLVSLYLAYILIIPVCTVVINHRRQLTLPKILKKQLLTFTLFFMCPYLAIELLQALAITFSIMEQSLYYIVGLATFLLIIAMHYALKHVMNLRFMNWSEYVFSKPNKKHAAIFTKTVEELSQAQTLYELKHITQQFFASAFALKTDHVHLNFPQESGHTDYCHMPYHIINTCTMRSDITPAAFDAPEFTSAETHTNYLYQRCILVYDDIAFNNFYNESPLCQELMNSLNAIDADIFLPLYHNNHIIASILIKKNARTNTCYSKTEQDGMLVFANYLSNSINLFHANTSDHLLTRIHTLTHNVYTADQNITSFKESIRSFVRTAQQHDIGILFYRNHLFFPGNQCVQKLCLIPLNYHQGHATVKQITSMAQKVIQSKAPHSLLIYHPINKQPITVSGSLYLNKPSALITLRYATIAHILYRHDHTLHNPTDCHYLLFLQTTTLGAHLTAFIAPSTEYLLNLKISMLKSLLSPHALLIQADENDIDRFVSFLPHAHSTKTIQTITIDAQETKHHNAYVLFGCRPSDTQPTHTYGLLEKIPNDIIIVIKNAHYLHEQGQQKLATFIESGIFSPFYEETSKKQSNAIIIVTTPAQQTSHKSMLNKNLYAQVKHNKLTIPAPKTWPLAECIEQVDALIHQIQMDQPLHYLITISNRHKKTACSTANSIHALHTIIQTMIQKKTQTIEAPCKALIESERENLTHIAQLGKKVLKDSDKMRLLWHAFHNQHAIARFLGVHASSVYKQCKKYNLRKKRITHDTPRM